MKTNYWSVAFTITVDGVQVDFMELQEQSRIDILMALMAGRTEGVFPDTHVAYQKSAS